jgi:hypothetical protein
MARSGPAQTEKRYTGPTSAQPPDFEPTSA